MQGSMIITGHGSVGSCLPPTHNLGKGAAGRMEIHFAVRTFRACSNPTSRSLSTYPGLGAKKIVQSSERTGQHLSPLHKRSPIKPHEWPVCGGVRFPYSMHMSRKLTSLQKAKMRALDQRWTVSAWNGVDAPQDSARGFTDDRCTPDTQDRMEGVSKEKNTSLMSIVTAVVGSFLILTAPGPKFADSTLTLCDSASADQFGQLRVLEKAAEGLSKVGAQELLDKVVTVVTSVTGISYVDPEKLDKEVDSLLSGEKDVKEEFFHSIQHTIENSWSTVFDIVTNFNPFSFYETAGSTLSGFLETGAERVAAFELSTLAGFVERWAILTPLFVLPMAWEMKRVQAKKKRASGNNSEEHGEQSLEAHLRGENVRRELERIELRTLVFDAVDSLGQTALQPPRSKGEAGLIRRRISDLLQRLEELSPVEDMSMVAPDIASSVSSKRTPNDALAHIPPTPTVDGDWNLIYVSEAIDSGSFQDPSFFPGVGLGNLRQIIWQDSDKKSVMEEADKPLPASLLARNTAEFRLGPFGVFQVGIHGSWENLQDSQRAQVSFDQISARPLEILGNKLSDDLPELKVTLPTELQRSAEWGIAYVDDQLRISRGGRGQMFLFRRDEGIPKRTQ